VPASRLPPEWSDELEGRAELERVDDTEWRRAYEASRRLPLDHYGDVSDPTATPPETAVVGSILRRSRGHLPRCRDRPPRVPAG